MAILKHNKSQPNNQSLKKLTRMLLGTCLLGREKESQALYSAILGFMKLRQTSSLSLFGSPGVGKSETINIVLKILSKSEKLFEKCFGCGIKISKFHGNEFFTVKRFYEALAEKVIGTSQSCIKKNKEIVEEAFRKQNVCQIIFLEELDMMLNKTCLKPAVKWIVDLCNDENSFFVFIATENRYSKKCRFTYTFSPYNQVDLCKIGKGYIRKRYPLMQMDEAPLMFLCKRVASHSGDCRSLFSFINILSELKRRITMKDVSIAKQLTLSKRLRKISERNRLLLSFITMHLEETANSRIELRQNIFVEGPARTFLRRKIEEYSEALGFDEYDEFSDEEFTGMLIRFEHIGVIEEQTFKGSRIQTIADLRNDKLYVLCYSLEHCKAVCSENSCCKAILDKVGKDKIPNLYQ
eukprot:snap_masked-scaffold_1-processed-gene-5.4-mRNA-1 protein AED:1.00 eAED:1.00 QI:0/0/0/0/1/1/2/0/408